VGQIADWTVSLDDGSRVHVHEYPDGSLVVHRDALDPARGPLRALGHVACETTLGRWTLLGLLGVGIAVGLSRLGFGFTRIPLSRMVGS
jgi:hypothetical protein